LTSRNHPQAIQQKTDNGKEERPGQGDSFYHLNASGKGRSFYLSGLGKIESLVLKPTETVSGGTGCHDVKFLLGDCNYRVFFLGTSRKHVKRIFRD
jgi:hypothetical protein